MAVVLAIIRVFINVNKMTFVTRRDVHSNRSKGVTRRKPGGEGAVFGIFSKT